MKKLIFICLMFLSVWGTVFAQSKLGTETEEQKKDHMAWWTQDRFGMFIHWGIYALPARHEWVKSQERITNEDYQKYFDYFDPDLYNPREWAKKQSRRE